VIGMEKPRKGSTRAIIVSKAPDDTEPIVAAKRPKHKPDNNVSRRDDSEAGSDGSDAGQGENHSDVGILYTMGGRRYTEWIGRLWLKFLKFVTS